MSLQKNAAVATIVEKWSSTSYDRRLFPPHQDLSESEVSELLTEETPSALAPIQE